jgi:abortive infection bacteriophage resistance protein
MVQYTKGPLTFDDQLQQLQQRGLQVADPARATLYLERVGYYRLMGYLFPFRELASDDYRPGASFEAAIRFYEFDQVLRVFVMEAIGHIEVAVRTAVTYQLGHAYGAFGHFDPANFAFDDAWHAKWLAGVDYEVGRARETFIDHYKSKYTQPAFPRVPIWMASEVMSLGTLSWLIKAMHAADRKVVASCFDQHASVFVSWLHAVSVVRNIAAHHGRLWNRVLGVQPVRPNNGPWQHMAALYPTDRMYFTLQVLRALLMCSAADAEAWCNQVSNHLRPLLATSENRRSMGALPGWEEHPLWRI